VREKLESVCLSVCLSVGSVLFCSVLSATVCMRTRDSRLCEGGGEGRRIDDGEGR